jgi:uncharacterized protein (TIGR00730 family)
MADVRRRARGRAPRQEEIAAPQSPPPGLDLSAEFVERTAPPPPKVDWRRLRRPKLAAVVPPPPLRELEKRTRELMALQGTHPDQDLIEDMILTCLKLIRDGAPRNELRIMHAALRELRYAFKTFQPFTDRRKVTVFGSARLANSSPEYQQAWRFAEEMVARGYMVITGAGGGIMEAAQGGAGRENSFGMNIRLPFEQSANPYIQDDRKLIYFRYFFTRKLCFVKEASAIALFPGGFGTHDECYETLTLVQTGKAALIPIVFVDKPGGKYWREWADYVAEYLLGNGLISEDDLHLFKITDDPEWAAEEIVNFYRRYHSSRYVNGTLVLRMTSPLSARTISDLNRRFKGMLKPGGEIRASAALLAEEDQPELAQLPRLLMAFNRRDMGRLRQLVDEINQA